jgi:hypothetical protein
MKGPVMKIMGVYQLNTRSELINEALLLKYGDVKLSEEQKKVALQTTMDELSRVVLVDLKIKNAPADFQLDDISQEGNSEEPYEPMYLTEDGKVAISRKRPVDESDIRVVFYLHNFIQKPF